MNLHNRTVTVGCTAKTYVFIRCIHIYAHTCSMKGEEEQKRKRVIRGYQVRRHDDPHMTLQVGNSHGMMEYSTVELKATRYQYSLTSQLAHTPFFLFYVSLFLTILCLAFSRKMRAPVKFRRTMKNRWSVRGVDGLFHKKTSGAPKSYITNSLFVYIFYLISFRFCLISMYLSVYFSFSVIIIHFTVHVFNYCLLICIHLFKFGS